MEHEETLGDDKYVRGFHTYVRIHQTIHLNLCILLYIDYASIKAFKFKMPWAHLIIIK